MMNQVSLSSNELAVGANEISEDVAEMTHSIGEIEEKVSNYTHSTQEMNTRSIETLGLVEQGRDSVAKQSAGMHVILTQRPKSRSPLMHWPGVPEELRRSRRRSRNLPIRPICYP